MPIFASNKLNIIGDVTKEVGMRDTITMPHKLLLMVFHANAFWQGLGQT